jgi:hypothetical protein
MRGSRLPRIAVAFASIALICIVSSVWAARPSLALGELAPFDDPIINALTNTPTRTPTPINVGNFVWDDLDVDGRQDAGEPGIAGVQVQLWNSSKTALLANATTNANGLYSLRAPNPGEYRVRVLLPTAADQFTVKDNAAAGDQLDSDINPTGVNAGFTDIYTFGSNLISITTIDAGIVVYRPPTPTRTPTPINVGNFIWNDLDADGQQDVGESGLVGIQVQLWNSSKTALLDTAFTNASGFYSLQAPTPGNYRVRVLLPSGASFAPKDKISAGDQLDSDVNPSGLNAGFTDIYTFGSNLISITTIDAGLINVPATPTPTLTPTLAPSSTSTPTLSITLTPQVYMPLSRY